MSSGKSKNILFIMFDQLRFDYLSCSGHPFLKTPNMDMIASKGVRFSRCYVQSPICGASRMSFYTGRYVASHGAAWNNFPLKVGELTLGDHLRKIDVQSWLIGKTHMQADEEGMERLGLSANSVIGARVSDCGFDVFERDDGLWAQGPEGYYDEKRSPYNEYLKQKGYGGENPWHAHANSGIDKQGNIKSGWWLNNASLPANIAEEDSETPYLTSRAIDFLDKMQSENSGSWMCHLSYIKPHWPYIVPAPYHNMYGQNQVQAVVRHPKELENTHPVFEQFINNKVGQAFQREEVRASVIPAYMGLIKQCDDQMGRLFSHLEQTGQMENTMIIITSDHGDYLGDHHLGEKGMLHEPSVKIPLIIYDPSPSADASRGTVCDELVESIDLAPTFLEFFGAKIPNHILEGRSLNPFLSNQPPSDWREFAVSEYDYSATPMAANLDLAPRDARLFMICNKDWKFIHAEGGFRPMLFDLINDPDECHDLGDDSDYSETIEEFYRHLASWSRRQSQRTTISDEKILRSRNVRKKTGVLLGVYDENEVSPDQREVYQGTAEFKIEPEQN
jgi:arylsulfatase A-like enzyme